MEFKPTSSQLIFYTKSSVLDSSIWNQSLIQVFPKIYTYDQLNDAYNKLRRDHEGLRVKFKEKPVGLVSYVEDYKHMKFPFIKVGSDEELLEEARKFVNLPMDFYGILVNPVIFHTPTKSGIIIYAHHIIVDGYSSYILAEDINRYLKNPEYRAVTQPYAEYIYNEEKHRAGKRYFRDYEFWKNEFDPHTKYSLFSYANNTFDYDSSEVNLRVETAFLKKIKNFCEKSDVSVQSFFNSVYAVYFYKATGLNHFTLGVPVLNRTLSSELNTIGLYMHIVPLVVKCSEGISFFELIQSIENSQLNIFRHQKITQIEIKKALEEKGIAVSRLFDVVADYQEFDLNNSYELKIPYSNSLSFPLEIHMQSFGKENHNLKIRYRTCMFTEQEIETMINSIIAIVEDAIEHPHKKIIDLEMLSAEEKQRVLCDFNDTAVPYPKDQCIHELFETQAEKTPDKVAVVAADKSLSYRELNEQANRIAHSLIEKGIGRGDIVGLMLPRKSYLLSALFGILKTGAAYLPIDPDHPEDRIKYMLSDSGAKLCITKDNVDELLSNTKTVNPVNTSESEDICYCIYTSGSTGKPKGTLITHRNVSNYVSANERNVFYGITGKDSNSILSVTTVGFDIFVTESILPLVNGMEIILADEEQSKIQSKLSELIIEHPVDVLQTTPTKMKAFITDKASLDYLKSFKVIILGGEALDSTLVKELKGYTDAKIYNIYGPTETTVWSAYAEAEAEITIGKPIANTQIYIVDKYLNPVPIGVMGELCIAGASVSAGYLNNPELTAEKFPDNPFGEGKLYRTGDNAYWREDGNIVYVGRSDFQVKIRGLRIELGEIESALQSVEGIDRAAVVVRKDKEDRQLICAFCTGKEKGAKELREELGVSLPKYMIPHIFTHLDEMPMTTSGKINRNGLPEIDLESISTETEYEAPETEKEILLTECISKVLNRERVSVADNFFDIGGDSLKAIELTARLEEKEYTVSVRTIFSCKDIRELAEKLEVKEKEDEKKEYGNVIPATAAQLRVYTAQMMKPDSMMYNVTFAFRTENPDKKQLEKAVNGLIERHESLRTRFENINGEIMQIIEEKAEITVEDISDINSFAKPFELNRAPLIRVGCTENEVVISLHHITVDGESMPVFFKELNDLYMGRKLSDTVQYGEFAVTQGYTEENEKYWLREFAEKVPELNLPTDYPRGVMQSFRGNNLYELIDIHLHRRIEEKSKERGITPYVYYMACFSILLSKLTGNEDIAVGTPISGRQSRYLDTVGMFVNTIALRSTPKGEKTVAELLGEIRDSSIEAIDNQSYPFGELVKKLGINTAGRNPLFDVMLAYQSYEMTDITFADKKAEVIPLTTDASKCDLTFNILPRKEDVVLAVEYCSDLYSEATVRRFIEAYSLILTRALDEETLIRDISALNDKDKNSILHDFNDTAHVYDIPEKSTLYSLFDTASENNKGKVCIKANDKEITFERFKAYAERIDSRVRAITNEEKSVIAVIAERSFEMYGAIYGIIRGGNAYLPIAPDYPQDRIDYILRSSGAAAVVAQSNFCHLSGDIPCIDATEAFDSAEKPKKTLCLAKEDDTAYVIYTSGSTGNPKGAKISHKSAVNRILWMHDFYPLEENDVILQKTPYTFDVSVWEIFWWGITGGTLCVSKPDEHFLPAKILEETAKNKVTHLHFVPSVFDMFLTYLENNKEEQSKFSTVKYVFLSGEVLTAKHVNRFYRIYDYSKVQLHNLYGPTECAVDVSCYACLPTETDPVPIGKPIYNTKLYITDKYMNPVPVGVTGELCIGGMNVGQGYLNNPELTAEKFPDNPFGEGKLYRTGDNAYWREDGNIVYVGRSDFQVKIRGLRIELGEIESALQSVEGIDRAAVVVRKDKEDRQLICAFCTGKEKGAKELREELGVSLPKYMIPHIFTHLDEMPMTTSGKINRNGLPEIDLESISTETEYEAPETEKEILLTECISKVLNRERVSVADNFFDIGGDSLKAIELTARLEEKEYTVSVRTIFSCKDIRELAEKLEVKEKEDEKKEYGNVIPATAAQLRVYTAQMMKPDSMMYNVTFAFRTENPDKKQLEKAVNGLIERHESLRTRFENINGEIMQIIEEKAEITVEDISDINSFAKPFELNRAPLIRVGCTENEVVISLHHITVDGESMPVFFKELNDLYMGRKLSDTVQYGEFAVTQGYTEENEKYWLREFAEKVPELNLPTDYPRGVMQSFRGNNLYELIDIHLHRRIEEKSKERGITPYVYYMACFSILLSKLTGNEDIAVGTPISGRQSRYLDTVGMFVNTIALRSTPKGEKTVAELLGEIRDSSIEAIDNQSYPFGELVKKLGINTAGRNPLFDVMLAYQSYEMTDITFADKKAEVIPLTTDASKCDLTFNILPRKEDVVLAVEYCSDLYSEATVRRFIEAYSLILTRALDEETLIRDISALNDKDKNSILHDFNDTAHVYDIPEKSTLYSLFDTASENNKGKVCIKANDKEITFERFKAYAERIDSRVRAITNEEKSVIAVIAERSFEMYGAIYGIIRGGNAYLPIAPDYPQDRIDYILRSSGAAAVVAQSNFCHLSGDIPCIDATEAFDSAEKPKKTLCLAKEDDTAYVIYTSGSTGNPKGAKISHKSAVNRILWMHDFYPLEENDVILQKTPYTFDVSVWEIFWWGITGGTLCVSKPDEHFLPAKILEETAKNKVTHLHFVPSVFDMFLTYLENNKEEQSKFSTVKYVFLSGEVLTAKHVNRFYRIYDYSKVQLHNLYGPTECAVDVSCYACLPTETDPVPIGKPIYNTKLYITDKYMNPVPVGVTGELCIGGMNVGQGYLNNPELTAEKFPDNPFGEGKLYRTGDNAYWREDGSIIFCGRRDSQIKLNGQRIELGEIENTVRNVDGVVQCAVIVREQEKQQFICAFYTGKDFSAKELRSVVSDKLPQYMVPHIFIHLDEMPMTTSGKINRNALPETELINISSETEFLAPYSCEEKALAETVCSVLKINKANMLDNFFNMGGDSIKAIYIASDLEAKGYELRVADIMQSDTLSDIAKVMKPLSDRTVYEQREVNGFIPFTPIMDAYIKENGTVSKDFVHTCVISADCDEVAAQKALDALVSHHDILRGTFCDGGIEIHPSEERRVYSFRSVRMDDENEAKEYLKDVKLSEDKLVSAVFCITAKANLISITIHHFLVDLVSWEILIKDFQTAVEQLKNKEEISLPPKTAPFILWNEELHKYSDKISEESSEYWKRVNEKLGNVKSLCSDAGTVCEAEAYSYVFDKDVSDKIINEIDRIYGVRANEVLLTALGLAACNFAQGSVGIVVESHGRTDFDKAVAVERTVGWFTSCYPVVFDGEKDIVRALIRTKVDLRKVPENGIDYLLLSQGLPENAGIIFNFYRNSITNERNGNKLIAFDGGSSAFSKKIDVNCIINDGIITVNISVPECIHKKYICEDIGTEFVKQIVKIADLCAVDDNVEQNLSDFSDEELTEQELDELKELFDWTDDDEQ